MPSLPDRAPTLTDGVVTLRAHLESDLPRLVEFAADDTTRRWIPLPHPYGPDQAREFLETVRSQWQDGTCSTWAIERDGAFAGSINLKHRHREVAEIGYGAHPGVRGHGVMTRAARLVTAHGFDDLGLRTIVWRAGRGNFASRRVAWASGFTVDGTWPAMHRGPGGEAQDLWIGHLHHADPRRPAHPWWRPAVLDGSRVRLRPWRDDDPPPALDEPLRRYFVRSAPGSGMDVAAWRRVQQERMACGEGVFWCIADPESDIPRGHLQVIRLDQPKTAGSGMVGYFLTAEARGKGLLQAALDLLVPHAFTAREAGGLGLHRLEAGTDERNTASQRALRRAGFTEFSRERRVLAQPDGPATGAVSFELLATDDREKRRVTRPAVPVLHTDRLTLRAWTPGDRPRADQPVDAAAARFMPAGAQPTAGTFDQWLARRERLRDAGRVVDWCISDRADGRARGHIGLFGIGDGTPTNAEVGYWLHTDSRGRGYVTEAIGAVVAHAFAAASEGGMGLTRLHAGTDLENVASQQVLERAGFARWGVDHQACTRSDGTTSDGAYYELLATDLRHG